MTEISSSEKLQVTTLNMLHDIYLLEHRVHRVACELQRVGTEIFFAQEVIFEDGIKSRSLDVLSTITQMNVVAQSPMYKDDIDTYSGTAVMSKYKALESGLTWSPSNNTPFNGNRYEGCYAVLKLSEKRVLIAVSAHGGVGGNREYTREQQFLLIDKQIEELEDKYRGQGLEVATILAGDFNCVPDSSTIRFLTGKSSLRGNGSYWVDVWSHTQSDDTGYTFDPHNKLAARTAATKDILFPEMMPYRRIDYILVRGWVYGKLGCPLSSQLVFNVADTRGYTESDHYGIHAEILNPL